jgi:predicted dehydrogenase
MATTVHALDFGLWVLGNPKPAQVTAFTYSRLRHMREPAVTWEGPPAEFDGEDFAHAVVRFANGSWMSVESNWLMHPTARSTGIEYLAADGRASLHPLKIEVARGREVIDQTPAFTENPAPVRSFLHEAVSCARAGTQPVVQPEQIVQVQAVMDAIYRSAESGSTVEVDG